MMNQQNCAVCTANTKYKLQSWIEGEDLLLNICFPQCNAGNCWDSAGSGRAAPSWWSLDTEDDGNCKQAAKIVPD